MAANLDSTPRETDDIGPLVSGYRPLPGIFDEMVDRDGRLRSHWRPFLGMLASLGHEEINRRFPAYADLVTPKPPSVDQIKATLVEGEAMLSFYFGQQASFVWAVPKEGPVAFASLKLKPGEEKHWTHTLDYYGPGDSK